MKFEGRDQRNQIDTCLGEGGGMLIGPHQGAAKRHSKRGGKGNLHLRKGCPYGNTFLKKKEHTLSLENTLRGKKMGNTLRSYEGDRSERKLGRSIALFLCILEVSKIQRRRWTFILSREKALSDWGEADFVDAGRPEKQLVINGGKKKGTPYMEPLVRVPLGGTRRERGD